MKTKIFYLLLLCLMVLGRGEVWADATYVPTSTKTIKCTQDVIVTGTGESTAGPVLAKAIEDGWIKIPNMSFSNKTPASDSEMDTPTSNVYCLRTKKSDNFTSNNRVIHFRVTGITGVKAIGNINGKTSFGIGATEYSSSVTDINKVVTSGGDVVSYTGLDKSKTYIISIFSVTDDDQYLYAVRFYSDTEDPVSNISVANLCYAVGTGGKNANSKGLDRAVGGFNLTFGGGDGIKYNGGNQLIARYDTGTITIALDDNNSKKNITKVVMTRSAAGTGTFTASDNTTVTNSGTTVTWEGAACKTITFTQTGDDVSITNITITTDVAPTFEKVTPTVTISPTSASVKKGTAGTFTTTATSSPKNFNWTWTPTALANVEYYTKNDGGTKTANQIGEPGTFETSTSSTTTGNNTLVASFAGNDYFEAVPTAATYTLSINEPVASTPDATVQTYPYTWNFDNGSSTWGNSSTRLPISDWTKGDETYYNYNVPNSETGFNINAIKGLRFQNIGYLGLDWGYGHVYLTGGQVIIPSVPKGMIIKINASNNGQDGSATITPMNATYTGEETATVNSSYQDFTFVTSSEGSVTFTFSGVASIKSISVLKLNQNISYATTEISKNYGETADAPFINTLTETTVGQGITIAYTSSDEHVATVGADGTVTILNAGTTVITATAPGNDYCNEATASYTLTVNGDRNPTISWNQALENETFILTYGNHYTRTATQTIGGKETGFTVLYKSSDESKATVSNQGVVTSHTGVGTVTITAYVPGYERYNPTEISYTVNLAKAEFAFVFRPTSATVNAGCTITPDTNFPTMLLSDISSLTISSSNSNVATVPANMLDAGHAYLYYNAGTGQVQGLKPLITIPSNASAGSTATITMTFTSDKYVTTGGNEATFTVTVANASTCNFSWSDGVNPSYTLCEGDFMYLPEITGNSNGNNSLSNGTTNASTGSSTGKAYVYEIKNGTVTWNNKDYKLGQGVPDIQVLNTDGTAATGAYVFWVTGQGGYTSPDRLMIYGKTAGTYKIRAVDPQLTSLYCDATLIVTAKSSLTTAVSAYKEAMSFPYTWDFTKAVGTTLMDNANSLYWEKSGSSYIMKEALSFNYDYADEDGDGSTTKGAEDTYKIMSDGNGHLIPEFYGMTIALGNSTQGSWYSKVGRVRINNSSPYLSILGGAHYIQLPNSPGVTVEHPSSVEPDNYKLFMKLRGNGNKARIIISGGAAADMKIVTTEGTTLSSTGKDYEHPEGEEMGTVIVSYDVAKEEAIKLGLNNIDVYWIAYSTEAKLVHKPKDTTYPASTYCYPEALDLDKSAEANNVTSYYASNFSSDGSVIMTSISGRVEANTGLMLKLPSSTTPTPVSCYMVVDAKNTSSYSAPSSGLTEGVTNYLIHISTSGTVPRFVYDKNDVSKINYTNFILTNKYFDVNESFDQVGNANYRDWCFVRSHDASVSANMAYLRVNNRSGGIMSASRLMEEQTSENVDPASREMLGIVFEDDQNTTEVKSLSRDRNVVDDGWYTLQGVRVTTPVKAGLYIYKGKKITVK